MTQPAPLGIGLYGTNGHQLRGQLIAHPHARLTAIAGIEPKWLPAELRTIDGLRIHSTLEQLLADNRVDLVSLCSPRRADQARHATMALEMGRHVYAEKPSAMTEGDLDMILAAARCSGRSFHEMAGTAFDQPYLEMRRLVAAGAIGQVVQVLAQKSYPYHDQRPADEDVDGGIIMQCGIHAVRMIEHVAGVSVEEVQAIETPLGSGRDDGLRIAACLMLKLSNGGVAGIVANYLNPKGFGRWGNETLRIFGTKGMLESTDGGTKTRLIVGDTDHGPIDTSAPARDYFDRVLADLLGLLPLPLTLEEELHPTRIVIRAKQSAAAAEKPR